MLTVRDRLMDFMSPEKRSKIMRSIGSKNTKPELAIRHLVHSLGYRYRLHNKKLPGKPDLTFSSKRKVIFVHGCFWHQHKDCSAGKIPASRIEYWKPKLERNVTRDIDNQRKLAESGWDVLIIWECEIENIDLIIKRIKEFLE